MRFTYGETQDVLDPAVTLLFGIAGNHPFQQGNKRTGVIAAIVFLELNRFELDVDGTELLGELVTQVLRGTIAEDQFVEILRPSLIEIGT